MKARKLERKCATCGGPVTRNGTGLGTWECAVSAHNKRRVVVSKDLSGGKEADKIKRVTPVTRIRACKVSTSFRVDRSQTTTI